MVEIIYWYWLSEVILTNVATQQYNMHDLKLKNNKIIGELLSLYHTNGFLLFSSVENNSNPLVVTYSKYSYYFLVTLYTCKLIKFSILYW
jgi:hypothetical protein